MGGKKGAPKAAAGGAKKAGPVKRKAQEESQVVLASHDFSDGEQPGAGASSAAAGVSAPMARRLRRWSTNDHVNTVVKTKLSGYDETQLATTVGKTTGLTPKKYIKQFLHDHRGSGKNLSSEFWTQFFQEFNLTGLYFRDYASEDDAPEGVNEDINDDLLTNIALAHADNPNQRSPQPFINCLEYLTTLTVTEIKLCLRSCSESPKVMKAASRKMLFALLNAIGRMKLYLKFPKLWAKIKPDYDTIFSQAVSERPPPSILRQEWVIGNAMSLAPFLDVDSARTIEEALANKTTIPVAALENVMGSKIGSLIWRAEQLTYRYALFLKAIDDRLRELEDHHFAEEDYRSFTIVMQAEVRSLQAMNPRFDKKPAQLQYLAFSMQYEVLSFDDEWSFRYQCRIRTLAISLGVLPRLPWEELLYGKEKPLEGLPLTVKVPPEQVHTARNARNAAIKLLSGYEGLTFAGMKTIIKGERETLEGWDRHFRVDYHVLCCYAHPAAEAQLRDATLGLFPDASGVAKLSLKQSITELTKLQASPLAQACGDSMVDEFQDIISLLQKIDGGSPPTDSTLASMRPYFKKIMARVECFLNTDEYKVKGLPLEERLTGRDAMSALWEQFERTHMSERMPLTKPLARFSWMLRPDQLTVVDETVQRSKKEYAAKFGMLCDAPADGSAPAGGDGGGASASSAGPLALATACAGAASSSKKEADAVDALAAQKAKLLAAFGGF